MRSMRYALRKPSTWACPRGSARTLGSKEASGSKVRCPLSPTGSFRACIFWTLSEARSRLYRTQILQVNTRRKALDEIYIFSYAPFQISAIFQDVCTIFVKFHQRSRFWLSTLRPSSFGLFWVHLQSRAPVKKNVKVDAMFVDFQRRRQILQFFVKRSPIFSEFRRISVILTGVMPRLLYFRRMWKNCCNFAANFVKICLKKFML
jgi:hypothetical protein